MDNNHSKSNKYSQQALTISVLPFKELCEDDEELYLLFQYQKQYYLVPKSLLGDANQSRFPQNEQERRDYSKFFYERIRLLLQIKIISEQDMSVYFNREQGFHLKVLAELNELMEMLRSDLVKTEQYIKLVSDHSTSEREMIFIFNWQGFLQTKQHMVIEKKIYLLKILYVVLRRELPSKHAMLLIKRQVLSLILEINKDIEEWGLDTKTQNAFIDIEKKICQLI